mmetsp:Transcript_32917/g.102665  ORF Transcript_32917/g.102665 Transcript_32917/m.102665 type:complete len:293 (+) Transcript_32917:118-996(+)
MVATAVRPFKCADPAIASHACRSATWSSLVARDGPLVIRVTARVAGDAAFAASLACTAKHWSRPVGLLMAEGVVHGSRSPSARLMCWLAPAGGSPRRARRPRRRDCRGPRRPRIHRCARCRQLLLPTSGHVCGGLLLLLLLLLLVLLLLLTAEARGLGPGLLLVRMHLRRPGRGHSRERRRPHVVGRSCRDMWSLRRTSWRAGELTNRVVEDPVDGPYVPRSIGRVVASPRVELQNIAMGERQLLVALGLHPLAASTEPEQVAAQSDQIEASTDRVPLDPEVLAAHVLRHVV